MVSYSSVERELTAEIENGRVVELVDSLDSGSSVHCGRAGSSPASPTKESSLSKDKLLFFLRSPSVLINCLSNLLSIFLFLFPFSKSFFFHRKMIY